MAEIKKPDSWAHLRRFTPARVALGRVGRALPLDAVLDLALAHAEAKDAVWQEPDWERVKEGLKRLGRGFVEVESKVPDRHQYLLRPDWGRSLSEESETRLRPYQDNYDLALCVVDGLSGAAITENALPILTEIWEWMDTTGWKVAPPVLGRQGRVALGDEIGAALGARMTLVLIGERPGLSSPDSLGLYLTYAPGRGKLDSERNCISNVRPGGLSYAEAVETVRLLMYGALALQTTGVELKPDVKYLP